MRTRRRGAALAVLGSLFAGTLLAQAAPDRPARVVRDDPRLDRLLPPGSVVETIVSGFTWLEGPAWNAERGFLAFSDIPGNAVYAWRPTEGLCLLLRPSGYTGAAPFPGREPGSNGLAWDGRGRLILAEHGDRRVTRVEQDRSKTVLADRYRGLRLNSPNDVVLAAGGEVYFTDPPFGLPSTFDDPAKELPFSGVFRVGADGELVLLTSHLRAPNGIALSPDGRTLYVSNADRDEPFVFAFPVQPDGLGEPLVIFDAREAVAAYPGAPDGMAVDRLGNVFLAGPGGVFVLTSDGSLLGRILFEEATSNVAFGGDGFDLYVTVGPSVHRIRTATHGIELATQASSVQPARSGQNPWCA